MDVSSVDKNKQDALALVRLITDTVNIIAPGSLEAIVYGSATDPNAPGYPIVAITAALTRTHLEVFTWVINASGSEEPATLTAKDIRESVARALDNLRVR